MSAVADVLAGGADLIERDGWGQGVAIVRAGRLCAGVAIIKAAKSVRLQKAAAWAFCAETQAVSIPEWNDAPGRTQAEVIAALRAAAERARG